MQSWLKSHVAKAGRARRLEERAAEQSFIVSVWHPNRTAAGCLGHIIRWASETHICDGMRVGRGTYGCRAPLTVRGRPPRRAGPRRGCADRARRR